MGKYLLADLSISLEQLNHLTFTGAQTKLEENEEAYFNKAVHEVDAAIKKLYGGQAVSLQRLSATFRRGDLIEELG